MGAARGRRPDSTPPGDEPGAGARDRAQILLTAPVLGTVGGSWSRCRRVLRLTPVGPGVVVDSTRGCRSGEELGAVAAAVVVAPDRDAVFGVSLARAGAEGAVVFEEELELAVWAVGDGCVRSHGGCWWRRVASPVRAVCCAHRSGRAVRRASTGWVVRIRPVGSVQVAMPSAARVTVQPGRCLTRWWRRHRQSRLSSRVCPCGQGRTWSRSQNTAATWQPGNRQRRSRARTRLAIRFGGRYRSAPNPRRRRRPPTASRGPLAWRRSSSCGLVRCRRAGRR